MKTDINGLFVKFHRGESIWTSLVELYHPHLKTTVATDNSLATRIVMGEGEKIS